MTKYYGFILFMLQIGCISASPNAVDTQLNVCRVIESVIRWEALQQYYHIDEQRSRSPLQLTIATHSAVNCPQLRQFGKPVEILVQHDVHTYGSKTSIHFELLEIKDNTAWVRFVYAAEGIRGELTLKRSEQAWLISDSLLVEM